MSELTGLVVFKVRCAGPDGVDWDDWSCRHLDGMAATEGVRSATRFAVVPEPEVGRPGIGFTHVELVEIDGDLDQTVASVKAALVSERAGDHGRADHAVVAGEVLVPHGVQSTKAPVTAALTGHVMADVLCTDVERESDWNHWNDEVHVPDMVATGAFSGGSRWRRRLRPQWGSAHVTIYDVELADVTQAVERSAAAMPDLIAQGRKHPCHCGGPTLLLSRTC